MNAKEFLISKKIKIPQLVFDKLDGSGVVTLESLLEDYAKQLDNKNALSADVMPRFTKEDAELNKDAIQIAIAVLDWDNYNKELYDSPKDQVTDLYWLIDKLNGA